MECGPGVETDTLNDIQREMSRAEPNGRGEGNQTPATSESSESARSSTRIHEGGDRSPITSCQPIRPRTREASPVRESSLEDVIGSSKPDKTHKKTNEKKKSTLKRVFGGLKSKKSPTGEEKSAKMSEWGETEPSSPSPSKNHSISKMFQRVAQRSSVTRLFNAFGGGSSPKEPRESNEPSEQKAGSTKTLGRLMNYMGPVKLHGKKKEAPSSGIQDFTGGKTEQSRSMTLGRRWAENLGNTLRGFRSTQEQSRLDKSSPLHLSDSEVDRTVSKHTLHDSPKLSH